MLLEVRGDRLCVFYRIIRARSGVFFGALSSAPIAMPVANLERKNSLMSVLLHGGIRAGPHAQYDKTGTLAHTDRTNWYSYRCRASLCTRGRVHYARDRS